MTNETLCAKCIRILVMAMQNGNMTDGDIVTDPDKLYDWISGMVMLPHKIQDDVFTMIKPSIHPNLLEILREDVFLLECTKIYITTEWKNPDDKLCSEGA